MNYILHLNPFLKKVEESDVVFPTHISLYLALFHLWNQHHFQNPIAATRTELMQVSKISSKTTFHKCVKDLVAWKWIEYRPSSSIYRGSSFRILPFSARSQKEADTGPINGPGAGTSAGLSSDTSAGTRSGSAGEPVLVSNKQTNTNLINPTNDKINFKTFKNYHEEL